MPSEAAKTPLRDILQHIDLATNWVCGLDYAAFQADTRTVYAVSRCLEIISEASRRLPDDLKARYPSVPWTQIAASGNIYRHEYEDVARISSAKRYNVTCGSCAGQSSKNFLDDP
jgi:uncharacterized protein with HEPN domain